jgi:DNA-binding MarR family transcriptional regulator
MRSAPTSLGPSSPGEPANRSPSGGPADGAGETDEAARLRAALLGLGRLLRNIDAGSGLTPTEMAVVAAVDRCGPIRPSDLARHQALNPTMLSRVLTRLVEDGTLARDECPGDGRVALMSVTVRGRQLHQQLQAARAAALRRHMGRLPLSQQQAVSAALPALEALVELLGSGR